MVSLLFAPLRWLLTGIAVIVAIAVWAWLAVHAAFLRSL
jgi:hypothetical protein